MCLVSTPEPAGENPRLSWAWGDHSDQTTPALLKGLSTNIKVIPQHYSLSLTLQQTPSPFHTFERKNSSRDQAHLSSNLLQNLRTFTNLSNTSFIDTTPHGAWGQQGPYVNSSAYLVSLPASMVYTNNDSISIPQRNYQNALMNPSSFSLASSVRNFQQSDVRNSIVAAADFQPSLEESEFTTSGLSQQSKMKTGVLSDSGQISFRSSLAVMSSYALEESNFGSLTFETKYFNPVDFKKSQKKSAVPILLKIRPRLSSSKGIRVPKTFDYADLYKVPTVGFSEYDSSLVPHSFMINPLRMKTNVPSTDNDKTLNRWLLIKKNTEGAKEETDFIFVDDDSSDDEAEDEQDVEDGFSEISFTSFPSNMSPTYYFSEDELSSDKKDEDEFSVLSVDSNFLDQNPDHDEDDAGKVTTPTPILPEGLPSPAPSSEKDAEEELSSVSFGFRDQNPNYHFSDDDSIRTGIPTLPENRSQLINSEHIPYANRIYFTESLPQHLEDLEETVVTWVKESVESIKNFMISYLEKEQLTEEDFHGKWVRYHQYFQKTLATLLEHTYGIIYTFLPAFEEDVLADTLSFKGPPLSSSNLSSEDLGSLQETPLSLETALHLWKEDLKGYIDSFHSEEKYISSLISQKEQEVLSPLPFFYYIYKGIKASYQEGDNEIELPYDMYLRALFLVQEIDFKGVVFKELDDFSLYPKFASFLYNSKYEQDNGRQSSFRASLEEDEASDQALLTTSVDLGGGTRSVINSRTAIEGNGTEDAPQQSSLMASLEEDEASDQSGRSTPSSLAISVDLGGRGHSVVIQEDLLAQISTENENDEPRTIIRRQPSQADREGIYPYGIDVDGFALLGQVRTPQSTALEQPSRPYRDEDWEKTDASLDAPNKGITLNSVKSISGSPAKSQRSLNSRAPSDSKLSSSVGTNPVLEVLKGAQSFGSFLFSSKKSSDPDTSRQGIIIKGSYKSLSEVSSSTRAPNPILRGSYKNFAEDYEMDF